MSPTGEATALASLEITFPAASLTPSYKAGEGEEAEGADEEEVGETTPFLLLLLFLLGRMEMMPQCPIFEPLRLVVRPAVGCETE